MDLRQPVIDEQHACFTTPNGQNIDSSQIKTHLLPAIVTAVVLGVDVAMSSSVMKFEPPPKTTLFSETESNVCQRMFCVMDQSSGWRPMKSSFLQSSTSAPGSIQCRR